MGLLTLLHLSHKLRHLLVGKRLPGSDGRVARDGVRDPLLLRFEAPSVGHEVQKVQEPLPRVRLREEAGDRAQHKATPSEGFALESRKGDRVPMCFHKLLLPCVQLYDRRLQQALDSGRA